MHEVQAILSKQALSDYARLNESTAKKCAQTLDLGNGMRFAIAIEFLHLSTGEQRLGVLG